MSQVTITTEQVHELIEQLAAMTAAASITPEMVANIFENMRQLNDQEKDKIIAITQAYLQELNEAGIVGFISKETIQSEEDDVVYETDEGTVVGTVGPDGADFINLKRGGQQVARMSDLPTKDSSIGENPSTTNVPTTKAVKDYVDDNIPEVPEYPIETETTQQEAEEVIIGNDTGTQQYAKVSSEGIRAVAYHDMQGNNVIPTKESSIGETPSQTNVPTSKAVADYVSAHGGGDLPISKESTASVDEEHVWGNDAGTDTYAKIGEYGIKAKKLLGLDGSPYLNMAENLQDYLLDAITYKPLGKLSKPYLVVIMDDGNSAAATYTIPNIVINEGIPITFALASNSQIITNNTYLQTLQSAISNYGCGVCQHGFSYWGGDKGERAGIMLTEQELVAFFENEKQAWEALNIECLGAACPDHLYDYKTMAVAFHYWHVLCNGVGHSIYPQAVNCERTNRLELQRMSLRSFSETQLKNAIDYTYANNGLLIVFSHDTQFQDNLDNCRDKLLSIVPYAQTKGLTICSLNKVIKDEFLIHSK